MQKTIVIIPLVMLMGLFIAGCTNSIFTSPAANPTSTSFNTWTPVQEATKTLFPIPVKTSLPTLTIPSTTPTPLMDAFLANHPSWKVAYIDTVFRLLCINAGKTQVACLKFQDYDSPSGFRRELGSWSPDGTRFAYDRSSDTGIYLWTIREGTEPFKISEDGRVYRYPIWSPDGQFIAYQMETVAFSGIPADTEGLYVESLDHSIQYHLSQQKTFLDWSADGKKILFAENNAKFTEGKIISANMDGTQAEVILQHPGPVYRPRWSPDGSLIAFLADPEQYKLNLYVMKADGSDIHKLVLLEYGGTQARTNYAWLPEGRQILYADQLIDAETGAVTKLFISFDPSSAIWFMK